MYARAWECDYQRPNFDAEYNIAAPSKPEAVQSDLQPDETWNTPGTSGERSPKIFLSTDGLCEKTEMCHNTEDDAVNSLQQDKPAPINPSSSK